MTSLSTSGDSPERVDRNLQSRRQRSGPTLAYGVSVSDFSPAPGLAPWQRTAAGAGLLAADGRIAATIFAEMSALALRTGSINLGQGFPDEDGPVEVLEAARQAIADGVNQYPPGIGLPVLREAIAAHQQRFYGIDVDAASEVLVTAGATEALAATILAFVDTGDEVVTFEPYYDAYAALIARAGGVHRTVPLRYPDWRPDPDELRAAVTDRTRLIIVNSPHNPTGVVFDDEVLELVVELANRHDALIVTDEVYEHLTFGSGHRPIATIPGAWDRTVSISSGGKTFSTTGWKIGWLTAPAPLVTAVLAVKQYLTYVNGAPVPAGDRRGSRPARPVLHRRRRGARGEARRARGRPHRRWIRGVDSAGRILRDRGCLTTRRRRRRGLLPRAARSGGRGRRSRVGVRAPRPARRVPQPRAVRVLQAAARARGGVGAAQSARLGRLSSVAGVQAERLFGPFDHAEAAQRERRVHPPHGVDALATRPRRSRHPSPRRSSTSSTPIGSTIMLLPAPTGGAWSAAAT